MGNKEGTGMGRLSLSNESLVVTYLFSLRCQTWAPRDSLNSSFFSLSLILLLHESQLASRSASHIASEFTAETFTEKTATETALSSDQTPPCLASRRSPYTGSTGLGMPSIRSFLPRLVLFRESIMVI